MRSNRAYVNGVSIYRASRFCSQHRLKLVGKIFDLMLFLLFSSVIPPSVVIGRGTYLSHRGMSVVIHRDSVIGENVTIGTCVTIGGRGKGFDGAPKIGNNVYIGTGAKILGDITIGNDVVIGANSVVIRSVPNGATVVGIPARQV